MCEAVQQQAPADQYRPRQPQAGKDVVEEKTRPVRIDSTDNRETLFSCKLGGTGRMHALPRVAGVSWWFLVPTAASASPPRESALSSWTCPGAGGIAWATVQLYPRLLSHA